MPLKSACVRGRSRSVYSSPTIVMLRGMRTPVPSPCTARATISIGMLVAAPASIEPIRNSTMPIR